MAVRTDPRARKRRGSSRGFGGPMIIGVAILVAAFILSRAQRTTIVQAAPIPAPVVGEFDMVRLPVPLEFVPAGTRASTIRFKEVSFPRHQVPENAIVSVAQLGNSTAIAALPANLPVFAENFTTREFGNNAVVERIPPGMRAMTISVDATSVVEGWAGSGAIVDVLLIEKDRTTVIAEKVRILSAERRVSPIDIEASPSVPRTVTLLVGQEQCLAINTAVQQGKIALALRGLSDDTEWSGDTYSSEQLRGGSRSADGATQDISGIVIVKDNGSEKSFALSGRKWVPTEVVPEGFLLGR